MKKFLLIAFAIVVVTILVVGGCAPKAAAPAPGPGPTPTPAVQGPSEILLGSNVPLTGMMASFGSGNGYGVEAAVEDQNKLGGVYVKEFDRKIPIKLIVVDSESDATKAGALQESLITRDKVNFLVPPNQPLNLSIPIAIVSERYKIPTVTGGTPMEPWFAVRDIASPPMDHIWTQTLTIATPGPAGTVYAEPGWTILDTCEQMMNMFGTQTNKKVGVLASDDPDGGAWYNEFFPSMLQQWGYNVIGFDKKVGLFPLDTNDFTSIVQTWKAANVEVLACNCPGPPFGIFWKQAQTLGFKPKLAYVTRAALYIEDVGSWGGDLPQGIMLEKWWDPSYQNCPGIGGTTPQSLTERWITDSKLGLNPGIGWGYELVQVLFNAIERAGTLDTEAVNKALGETNMATIATPYFQFDEKHSCRMPLCLAQWQKTDKPWVWECPIIFSKHDFIPTTAQPIFPLP
jgi:branched-chain amino acid transport system substrate-binding protein